MGIFGGIGAAFKNILAKGGEMGYAMGKKLGYPGPRLEKIMDRKWGEDFGHSKGDLDNFAAGMLQAGSLANDAIYKGGQFGLRDLPNNPFFDEQESGGNLFRWSADVTLPGSGKSITVYGFSSSTDPADLFAIASALALDIAEEYPGRFGLSEDNAIRTGKVTFNAFESVINNGTTAN